MPSPKSQAAAAHLSEAEEKKQGNVTVGGAEQKGVAKRPRPRDGDEESEEPPATRQGRGTSAREPPEPSVQPKRQRLAEQHRITPSPEQLDALKRMLEGSRVPILSAEEATAALGLDPRLLGAGANGEAYLNPKADLVVKFAFCYKSYRCAMREALALDSLREVPGVQRLVGVCLERALIVTRFAGPTL